jgi:hypothetical protein
MTRIAALIIACAMVSACVADPNAARMPSPVAGPPSAAAPPGAPLAPASYLTLVKGNTIEGSSATAGPFAVFIAEDGSQRLQFWVNGVERRDAGRITAVEETVCSSWGGVRGGAPRCSRIFKDGDTLHAVWADGGGWNSSYRIVPGNPRNL